MDLSVLHALNSLLFHNDALEDPLLAYVQASEALFIAMLVVVLAIAYGVKWRPWRRAAAAAGLSAGLALGVGQIIGNLTDRARPFVAHPHLVHLFVHHAADASFPSDHATASFAIGVAILLRRRSWGIVVLVLAVILSVGRVALGLHYPTDMIGGALLGSLAALLLWWPPLRSQVDRLSDAAGRLWDLVASRLLGLLRRSVRA
jgi:undecaprenyl-diphosphatase